MDQQLKQKMFELFDTLQKESIEVTYSPIDIEPLESKSKFGGKPHLPEDFQWPHYEGESYDRVIADRPLSFLAEIYLSELPDCDAKNLLPKRGVLSFFYEFEQRVSLPSYEDFFQLMGEKGLSQEEVLDEGEFNYFEFDSLREAYGCTMEEFGENSKISGYPDVIQNPMELECEMVTRGYYLGDEQVSLSKALEEEIERQSKEWLLLFQMGTVEHEDFQLIFGDYGHIYFWIKQGDLLSRNFDGIWQILQCG
jgi:uncharacterized protein YwqG